MGGVCRYVPASPERSATDVCWINMQTILSCVAGKQRHVRKSRGYRIGTWEPRPNSDLICDFRRFTVLEILYSSDVCAHLVACALAKEKQQG